MQQTRQLSLRQSGEEEEAEHVGDDEHVEDEAPMAAACKGSRQQWTNGCSNAASSINNCSDRSKCFARTPERRMLAQFSRDSSSDQSIWTVDQNSSEECEKDVPVEASIVHRFAMARLDWAPISYHGLIN